MSVSGQRICRIADQASAAVSPAEALSFVRELREEIDDFERQQVARALTAGEPVSAVAKALGVSRQSAHRRFRDLVPPSNVRSKRRRPTPEARLVVEYAQREAKDLGATTVRSEHLLLGTVRFRDHAAAAGLEELGVTIEAARTAAVTVQESSQSHAEIKQEVNVILSGAIRAAHLEGADRVGVEHILVGALSDPASGATAVLRALGVTPDAARRAVAKATG